MAIEVQQSETVRYGVDTEQFAAFLEYAREHPEDVQFELAATGHWKGRAFRTSSKLRTRSTGT